MTAAPSVAAAPLGLSRRDVAVPWIADLHDAATALFTALDRGGEFREDRWIRPGGGGGVTRVLAEGETFEKVGVNRSAVEGELPAATAQRFGARVGHEASVKFFATGLSIVAHPRNPHVPTVHLNVRYFELVNDDSEICDTWFGGGTDLTPTYPTHEDARSFHRALKSVCDEHHASFYPRFKPECDVYFRNTHRANEARGVGGVFFDHLRSGEDGSGLEEARMQQFVGAVGRSLEQTYAPIVERARSTPHGESERALQLARRARYAEFNLLHDKGTLFGLQTSARIESVLMSLPPLAAWDYMPDGPPDALGQAMAAMLIPRDWAE